MSQKRGQGKRLFVIDTNVLMHDPSAIYRFEEHDIFIPMVVLEELDNNKKGLSEVARNVRQVSRYFADIIANNRPDEIRAGLQLHTLNHSTKDSKLRGRLFFQTHELTAKLPHSLPGNKPDNGILETVIALKTERTDLTVILVSKDINLRIKATLLGINAEDYFNDQVIDDIELLHKGTQQLADDFWEKHGSKMQSWKERDKTFYRLTGDDIHQWYPNMFLTTSGDDGFSALVREIHEDDALIELTTDYRHQNNAIWGITARNQEQNFALNLL
ncbi:MAG: PIN domain-containing protein, partial [Gammaproteobacteria bacterium]